MPAFALVLHFFVYRDTWLTALLFIIHHTLFTIHYSFTTLSLSQLLTRYAAQYETEAFLPSDPSWFMHQVEGRENQETTAFIASCLSYGGRKQFMPKIQQLLDMAVGDMHRWVSSGDFTNDIPDDDGRCFYRLYTYHTMRRFLYALQTMIRTYGGIGGYVRASVAASVDSHRDGLTPVKAFTDYFAACGIESIIPKNTSSACKRLCMFMRWMVRDNSPVDLGLWASFIDKRTLIIPLDTHVLQEARRLGLIDSKTASMTAARKLTARLAEIFPDDPLKGDFALFGYGVNH